jgi:hypothetical protein
MRPPFPSSLRLWERFVAGRLIAGLPKSVDLASLSLPSAARRRRRRAFAAFVTGATLVSAGWIGLQADAAGASNDGRGLLAALFGAFNPANANPPGLIEVPIDSAPAPAHKAHRRTSANPMMSRRAVCVRLCDGFFFPAGKSSAGAGVAGGDESCASLCPDAPTALYFLRAGSDRIEDATSASGARYTALPAALRYRATLDNACACHRAIAQEPPYWQDPTLRKGDVVVTPHGLVVFRGGGGQGPYARRDFTSLAAASMSGARRAELAAIERASVVARADSDGLRVAAASARPKDKAHGVNELRFATPQVSATN